MQKSADLTPERNLSCPRHSIILGRDSCFGNVLEQGLGVSHPSRCLLEEKYLPVHNR